MDDTTTGDNRADAPPPADLAMAGRLLDRAGEMLSAVHDMAEAAGDLLPNTTDEDKARAVLQGQMALCLALADVLHRVGQRLPRGAA